jgi:hypothetical protein
MPLQQRKTRRQAQQRRAQQQQVQHQLEQLARCRGITPMLMLTQRI